MKLLLLLIMIFSSNANSAAFTGTFWQKKINCQDGLVGCLPKEIEKPSRFDFEYPKESEINEITINGRDYLVDILIKHHVSEIDFYSIQFTMKTLSGDIIFVCSRYEAVRTVENVFVGSCGGRHPKRKNIIVGFTVSL